MEHDPDGLSPVVRQRLSLEAGHLDAVELDAAACGSEDGSEDREERCLPRPAGAQEQHDLAGVDVEVQAVDRAHRVAGA